MLFLQRNLASNLLQRMIYIFSERQNKSQNNNNELHIIRVKDDLENPRKVIKNFFSLDGDTKEHCNYKQNRNTSLLWWKFLNGYKKIRRNIKIK